MVLVTHHIYTKEIDRDKDKNKIIYVEGVPHSYDPIGALLGPNPNYYSPPIGAIGVTPNDKKTLQQERRRTRYASPIGALIRPRSTNVVDQEIGLI